MMKTSLKLLLGRTELQAKGNRCLHVTVATIEVYRVLSIMGRRWLDEPRWTVNGPLALGGGLYGP